MAVAAIVVVAVIVLIVWSIVKRARRRSFIETYAFPPALAEKLREHHEQLSEDDAGRVLEALREWFLACFHARGKMMGMPSRVVDDAWHEFILMTRLYTQFCKTAFGRYLHHTPNAVAPEPTASKIPATLEVLEKAKVAPRGAEQLPALFTIDSDLGIPRGRHWTRANIQWHATLAVAVGGGGGGDGCLGCGDSGGDGCGGDGCGGCGGCGCG